jgi:SAM-dependent methyltransferase
MGLLPTLYRVLSCPDDGGSLRLYPDRMECEACGRDFAAEGDYVSLVSAEAAPLAGGTPYPRFYRGARRETETDRVHRPGWRIPGSGPRRLIEYKRRQVGAAGRLLEEGVERRELLCDFSAGPGYYTLPYARTWRAVIHCDLSLDSLGEARRRAQRENAGNILFVRMDYLRPPFRGTLPRILCLDSLVRGPEHERGLLEAIRRALAPDGAAIVDFHNWWHNPLRRLGLLPENFAHNRSYSRRELAALLSEAGISRYECVPFRQEEDPASPLKAALARGLPPTRWMYRFSP